MSMSIPSPYAASRTAFPLQSMNSTGPVYAGGYSGVPAGHPFAQSSISVPGVPPTSPKRKPGAPVEPARRPQSAPPPPAALDKRPSTAVMRDRPSAPPSKDGSGASIGEKGSQGKGGSDKAEEQQGKKNAPAKQASQPGVAKKLAQAGAAKLTQWNFSSTEPEFPPLSPRAATSNVSRTMLLAELDPAPSSATTITVTSEPEEKKRGWTKVKRALTGGNFRRNGRNKPKKLDLDLDGMGKVDFDRERQDGLSPLQPCPPSRPIDMTPRNLEMSGGGHGRRWDAPMSAGYSVPSVYAGMPGGPASHYDLRTSTIGYFPGHFVASAVDVGAVSGLSGSRTMTGVKGGAW